MNSKILKKYSLRWKKIHADILESLINQLTDEHIRFFIPRNFEGLPDRNHSKDVDIIIEPGSYKKASGIIYSVLRQHDIQFYRVIKYEGLRCWFGIDTAKYFSIHIDLFEGYFSKGFELFSFNLLYNNTGEYNRFKVLNKSYGAVLLFFYKVIFVHQLTDTYQEKINTIYEKEKAKVNSILKYTLSEKYSSNIIDALNNNELNKKLNNISDISSHIKRKIFFQRPFRTSYRFICFVLEKFYNVIICPRKLRNFIAVEGPDGVGKSTFIDILSEILSYYHFTEVAKSHIYHFRPSVFPNLGALGEKAGLMKEDRSFSNPHRSRTVGYFSSFVRIIYYWLDFFIWAPVKLRKDVYNDKFTIYDRYVYDFLVDPHRSRINLPYCLRKIFTKLVIQPRIVFVLIAEAETIHKRKQELTVEEIDRQLTEYKKLVNSHKHFIEIDATMHPERMAEQAVEIIFNRFINRIE